MRRLATALFATLALAAVTGCGGAAATPTPASSVADDPSAAPSTASGGSPATGAACAPAAAGTTPTVNATIKDFSYNPEPIQAKVGDVVTWKNEDGAPHTATLEDDSCGTDTLAQGASGALVFGAAGTYTYKCKIHPGQMKGFTVVVS